MDRGLRDSRLVRLASALAVVALCAAPALAAAGPIVVLAADRLTAEDRASRTLGRPPTVEVLRYEGAHLDDDLGLLGAEPVLFCATPTASHYALYATLQSAQEALDELNIVTARSRLAGADQTVTCLKEPPDNERLWQLHFLAALLDEFEGETEAADEALHRALVARPGATYDPSYPPQLGDRYRALQQEVLAAAPALLHVQDTPGWTLWIDGNRATSGAVRMIPGRHLLQVRTSGGLRGLFVDLAPGQHVLIGRPSALGGLAETLDPDTLARLAAQVIDRGGHDPDSELWFDDGDQLVRLTPAPAADEAPSVLAATRRVEIAAGGGYLRAGDWSYGSVALDVSVGLVGPLRVAVFGRPSIGEPGRWHGVAGPPVRPILTPFGVAAEVALNLPVRPRFGLGAQLAVNADGTVEVARFVAGVHGRVGVDVPLSPVVAVRVQGEFGHLHATPTASILAQLVIGLGRQER